MPPRATWKGHLKISLVSFSVRVFNATSSSSKISLNQLHKDCNQRLRQRLHCPEHGEVDRDEIVKGYEFEKGRYVVIDPEDLEKVQLETTRTIEVTQFVDRDELPPIYLNAPYYVAPEGPVADEAFRVIRTAMERAGKIAIGRFVVGGREHQVAIEVRGRGLLMTTLRSDAEVRDAEEFFTEIGSGDLDDSQVELARNLIEQQVAPLDTTMFRDRYQDALLEIIKARVDGRDPAVIEEPQTARSLSFMDALKASVADTGKPAAGSSRKKTRKKPPAASVKTTKKRKKKA